MRYKPILQSSPTANLLAVAQNLLALLGLRVSKTALAEDLGNHPAYPSLSALSDSLRLWGVKSMAVHLPKEELAEVPFPAVVQLGRNRGLVQANGHVCHLQLVQDIRQASKAIGCRVRSDCICQVRRAHLEITH
ncbi:MAG: hypothetical protein MUE81_22130 [Thermoflexibacter sp.]|nr:hypothetical protein [Thermoflexibacter sp.]